MVTIQAVTLVLLEVMVLYFGFFPVLLVVFYFKLFLCSCFILELNSSQNRSIKSVIFARRSAKKSHALRIDI